MTVQASWVLGLIVALQAKAPWAATYPKTAEAIARASEVNPAFDGPDGDSRTAAVLVAIARYESGFRIDAGGDCDATDPKTGLCEKGHEKTASSLGLFQINNSNFSWLGVTGAQMTTDPVIQANAALRMIKKSFSVCAGKPLVERLSWYARGGDGCFDNNQGRTRMRLAIRLFVDHPPPAPVPSQVD